MMHFKHLRMLACVLAVVACVAGSATAANEIDVWYGPNQTFGDPGMAQRWVNVLGNVDLSADVDSLWYSLNGGSEVELQLGPDTRRLLSEGDFNIQLDFNNLNSGANTVTIIARDQFANEVSQQAVTVNYMTGKSWPQSYDVDWTSVTDLQTKSQVVDGYWTTDANGLHCETVGYDRVIALGDVSWTDYEVTATMTMNALDSNGFAWPSVSPGFGITLRWPGHSEDDPVSCGEPYCGWLPSGGTLWYNAGYYKFVSATPLNLSGDNGMDLGSNETLQYGVPYVFKIRVNELPNGDSRYYGKVWLASASEPAGWDLIGTEEPANPSDEPTGSALIIAHHMDITVANVSIAPVVQGPSVLVSDDFSDSVFTNANWTFVNPDSDASTFDVVGGELRVNPESTVGHEAWIDANNLPRMRQAAALGDSDFGVEVKFNSALDSGPNAQQGVLIEQDDRRFVRVELLESGGDTGLFVADIATNSLLYSKFTLLPTGADAPIWLEVTRSESAFTVRYSLDGSGYTTVVSSQASTLDVTGVSLYG